MVSMFSPPDARCLVQSYNVMILCHHVRGENLCVIPAHSIVETVAVIPYFQVPSCYYILEKIGQDIATIDYNDVDLE